MQNRSYIVSILRKGVLRTKATFRNIAESVVFGSRYYRDLKKERDSIVRTNEELARRYEEALIDISQYEKVARAKIDERDGKIGELEQKTKELQRNLDKSVSDVSLITAEFQGYKSEAETQLGRYRDESREHGRIVADLEKQIVLAKGGIGHLKRQIAGLRRDEIVRHAEHANTSRDFSIVVDVHDSIVGISQYAAKMLGYDSEDLLHKNVYSFVKDGMGLRAKLYSEIPKNETKSVAAPRLVLVGKRKEKKVDLVVDKLSAPYHLEGDKKFYLGCLIRPETRQERKKRESAEEESSGKAIGKITSMLNSVRDVLQKREALDYGKEKGTNPA